MNQYIKSSNELKIFNLTKYLINYHQKLLGFIL